MSAHSSQISDIVQLASKLPSRRRSQFFCALGLMLAGGLAEFATISVLVPFIYIMSDPIGFLEERQIGGVGALFEGVSNQDTRLALASLFVTALLIAGIVRILISWVSGKLAMRIGYDLTHHVYRSVILQDYSFHLKNSSSEFQGSFQKINSFASGVIMPTMQAISAMIMIVFIVSALVVINPMITILAISAIAGLYLMISFLVQPYQLQNGRIIAAYQGQRMRLMQEAFGGVRDIIINDLRGYYVKRFGEIENDLRNRLALNSFLSVVPRPMIETLLLVAATSGVYFYSSSYDDVSLILPTAAAFALGMQRMLPHMQIAYRAWAQINSNAASTSDVLALVSVPVPKPSAERANSISFDREIRLEDVGFTYGDGDTNVLSGITLIIPKGAFVGVTGRTGSGKSTLVDLIMGLQLPKSGRICVDDAVLTRGELVSWRSRIAHVSQSVFLAEGTIRDNIALGVDPAQIDEQRLQDAVVRAELTSVLADLPDALNTSVGERGTRLSGGQRQRIGIARALYLNRDFLVLDEATSALDNETQAKVIANMRAMDEPVTIISITHRPDTLKDSDFVVHLDKGRLASVRDPGVAEPSPNS